jgi:hypothetical protein
MITQDRNVNPMLNLLKGTMTYLGFECGTFGVAVSIPNHYTIEAVRRIVHVKTDKNCDFST